MSQLTINLDENLLITAQAYARTKGQNLNALVAQMLQAAVGPPATRPVVSAPARPLSPRIQRLFGAVSVPAGFDYETSLTEALRSRYGV